MDEELAPDAPHVSPDSPHPTGWRFGARVGLGVLVAGAQRGWEMFLGAGALAEMVVAPWSPDSMARYAAIDRAIADAAVSAWNDPRGAARATWNAPRAVAVRWWGDVTSDDPDRVAYALVDFAIFADTAALGSGSRFLAGRLARVSYLRTPVAPARIVEAGGEFELPPHYPIGDRPVILVMSRDPAILRYAQRYLDLRPNARILLEEDIGPGSLHGVTEVIVEGHGRQGIIESRLGIPLNGEWLAQMLRDAGFVGRAPGARICVMSCNAMTRTTMAWESAPGVIEWTEGESLGEAVNRSLGTPVSGAAANHPFLRGSGNVAGLPNDPIIQSGRWITLPAR